METTNVLDNIQSLLRMPLIDRAMHIALSAHGGDRNKHDGELYILHPHRVAQLVRNAGGDDVQIAVAWLHDVVEDTAWTLSDLMAAFPDAPRVVAGVDGMTKRKGESLEDYWARCKSNRDSHFCKYNGDGPDNFRRNHLIRDDATRARLASKASRMFDALSF